MVRDVAYAGMVTRYLVDLEHGGELQVVRQNLETTSAQALERAGPPRDGGMERGAHVRDPRNGGHVRYDDESAGRAGRGHGRAWR